MIVFDLACTSGHRFEGWFASSGAFSEQRERGLVACPHCGNSDVSKAPMAPSVPLKANARREAQPASATAALSNTMPPQVARAIQALAAAQSRALENSTWVGDKFADTSRAMHYGERDHAVIHGRATPDEAQALAEEGVPVSPLPFPVAAPDEIN